MRRLWLVFSQTVTVAVALLFVVLTFKPEWLPGGRVPLALPAPTLIQAVPAALAASGSTTASFAGAAAQAAPAVVSVMATKRGRTDPHANVPGFEEFFGNNAQRRQLGLGSGVIVSPEGYLLTNHHVIEGATEIEVMLTDGRSTTAKVVGSDPETDIAVLKIDLPGALPVMRLGDVRALRVGDAVLAIGNPFNVGQTVTAGIVSALDRTGAGSQFQNFIQTDAAINPGNSGGALVDAAGVLVGINTAIFSRSGGSMGIGFAVPVDTARSVMEQLIAGGEVRRGWIGVEPRELTPELAESLALELRSGVLIAGVLQNGPAAKAGLQPGDVVVKVAERPVRAASDLFAAVASLEPGKSAPVVVQRGKQQLTLTVEVGKRSRDARAR
ncbi:MAG: trypsin-like peptidase domain-containing protein [Rubrivivax sp.]|nr:trypsin-like peptidase domain-containing protein [Rubrivivax sp.]